jgi:molybdopterin-containing oxidoreductase family membrane subunit
MLNLYWRFFMGSARIWVSGGKGYYSWLAFLALCITIGIIGYIEQLHGGLIVTNMRDPVSWGFYIGSFAFLVGVAAAAVVLVIPAYVYDWKPIKEIAIIGELLAISAVVMCMLFVTVDLGRPDRFWHLIPFLGVLNFPSSLLSWDVLVLNAYFLLNFIIVTHILYRSFVNKAYSKSFVLPLILFSIPLAVSIHSVTAFLFNGLPARPFWNSAILAPRFLTSAFCSGPAIILVLLQLLRRYTRLEIKIEAIWKIAELMAYAMFINLFLFGAEMFREFYSGTHHVLFFEYLFVGLQGKTAVVPYAWTALLFNICAFLIFLVPATRKNPLTLNVGLFMAYTGVYFEKGISLIIPGFTPSTLGQIYEYGPSRVELQVSLGVFGIGFLLFTLMMKVAIPMMLGEFHIPEDENLPDVERRKQPAVDRRQP